ncbi:S41 family peptidase [Anaerosacchariphilus polymeriproducens]|uniref:S41 family peptidase n=2 Tax=Anaerosacchariphilus polymeriproducens TaxID=1812858 RepID=A0A371AT72_9FIRM|nr:S41 family peptidase [Anaerosacchariphilus polymeriproducens]
MKGTIEKNKRWGKFIFGFVTGFATAILIVIGLNLQVANKFQLNSKSATSSKAEKSKESIDFTAVENKVNTIQQLINRFYLNKIDYDKMESGIYSGLVSSLGDPYSTYYTKDEFDLLMESTKGTYSGIGALLSQDPKTGIVSIIKVYEGTPSEEAGLHEGDMIYKVDDIEVTGMDLAEAVTHIKGKESSKVHLTIAREGESDYLQFDVERRKINVPTVISKMMDDKVGYIAVSEFDEVTYDQYTKALDQLIDDGMKGLVIDLRNNPGGNLDIVCKMVDEILGKGLIVYIEDKNGKREEFKSDANNKLKVPLAVLINGNSASASEIFAGAVKDYKIGTLVGTKTFGKGIVQQLIDLKDGSALKLTIASYFTPSGVNIHGVGIKPDEEVELSESAKEDKVIKPEEDNQLQKAIEIVTQ